MYAKNLNRDLRMITFTNSLNILLNPVDKIKISKKADIDSADKVQMLKAVRELNSGWKKSGSITQNLRLDSDNGDRGTY